MVTSPEQAGCRPIVDVIVAADGLVEAFARHIGEPEQRVVRRMCDPQGQTMSCFCYGITVTGVLKTMWLCVD